MFIQVRNVFFLAVITFTFVNSCTKAATLHVSNFFASTDTQLTDYITEVYWADYNFVTNPSPLETVQLLMEGNDYCVGVSLTHDYISVVIDDVTVYTSLVPTPINQFNLVFINNGGRNTANFRGSYNFKFSSAPVPIFDITVPPNWNFATVVKSEGAAIFGDLRVYSSTEIPESSSVVLMLIATINFAFASRN